VSLANSIRTNALSLVGAPYVLGNEAWYDVGEEPSDYKLATDCSGLVYSVMRKSGAKFPGGKAFDRITADGYWHLAKKIDKPVNVGDVGFVLNKGRTKAVHVILYIGNGETVEARGRKWGVVKYSLNDSVNGALKRGAVWGRFPWLDVGTLSDVSASVSTEPDIIAALFLKPRHTEITGQMVYSMRSWYGIPPVFTLTVLGMETSLGDMEAGGKLVQVHNYGAITKPKDMTRPWALLANSTIKVGGRDFLAFADPWKGMTAWGRLIKLGPPSKPGAYLAAAKAGDWAAFGKLYNPSGGDYVERCKAMSIRFIERARAAGVVW
jgi:hypothetical protein